LSSEPLRRCFREPIPAVLEACDALARAADAHVASDREAAAAALREADRPEVREWVVSIWGKGSPYVSYRVVEGAPPLLPKDQQPKPRMPSPAGKAELIARDGYHCRFCGVPVIRAEVRKYLAKEYKEALRWGDRDIDQHPAFHALWLQYDHVLPNARGGTSDLSNMVITCAPCNFGRMNATLEEAGLLDPRDFEPVRSDWDGLERVFKAAG
jgi:hypothetical protein